MPDQMRRQANVAGQLGLIDDQDPTTLPRQQHGQRSAAAAAAYNNGVIHLLFAF